MTVFVTVERGAESWTLDRNKHGHLFTDVLALLGLKYLGNIVQHRHILDG